MNEDFKAGAKAMFDELMSRSANNYHGNSTINARCQEENRLVESWAVDALREVDPEDAAEWFTITELRKEIEEYKITIARMKKEYDTHAPRRSISTFIKDYLR